MDQLIPPRKKNYQKYLPLLPVLLLIILVFGKKENRTILRGQIAYMMTDKVSDIERVYKDLEETLLRTMFYSADQHHFVGKFNEKVQLYPQYEAEITSLASHIARTYGGEFVVWKDDSGKQSSLYGIPQNEVPNVDQLPRFGNCENLSDIGLAICAEYELAQFIQKELKQPKTGVFGGVTIEILVNKDGQLSDFEVIASSGTHESLKKEALRVAKKMPKWTPALRAGKAVDCQVFIPFIFEAEGVSAVYAKKLNLDVWKIKDSDKNNIVPMFKMHKAQAQIQNILTDLVAAKSNKERKFHAVQFSKTVRALLMKYPDYEEELNALFIQETKFYNLNTTPIFDEDHHLIDIQLEVEEKPEASNSEEDKLYADLYNIMQSYEGDISVRAELDLEQQLGDVFWDFINRFPDDLKIAQAALQHACNSKKISTHTVKVQEEEYQVIIDLIGRRNVK